MTTHEGHDHPNTKAGRAACRKAALQGEAPKTAKQASKARHPSSKAPARKASVKREPDLDPALPHEFDSDTTNPKRCYVCKRSETANIHTEGPQDLAKLFTFGR